MNPDPPRIAVIGRADQDTFKKLSKKETLWAAFKKICYGHPFPSKL